MKRTDWLAVIFGALVGWLLCVAAMRAQEHKALTKTQVKVDIDYREGIQELKKRCPACKTYLTVGEMALPDGQAAPCAFVFIRDGGKSIRVSRTRTRANLEIITVVFPAGVLDAELVKFIKGDE